MAPTFVFQNTYTKITCVASRLYCGNLASLVLFLAPFIATKSKARRKPIVKSRSILSMLPTMPKKKNTEEHQEIKPTSPIMKPQNKAKEKAVAQKYDIGSFINEACSLSKSEKFKLIENVWKPHEDFKFPTFTKQEGVTKSYYCKWIWLKNRTWLTYSPSKDALFCFGSLKKSKLASTGLK